MRTRITIVALLLTVSAAAFGAHPALTNGPGAGSDVALAGSFERMDAPVVVETADPSIDVTSPEVQAAVAEVRERIDRAEAARLEDAGESTEVPAGRAALGGGLVASFDAGVPAPIQTVVRTAVADWDAVLETPQPVVVRFFWECFNSPGLLGFAGPTDFFTENGYVYPAALANNLAGSDLNGPASEIEVTLNAELAPNNTCLFEFDDWYISLDDNPGPSQIDLYSVVLHEVGHGLGFQGSALDPDGSGFAQPQLSFPRFIYDRYVYAGSSPLLSVPSPNSELTGNDLYFDIGGERLHRIYAPSTFRNGSSFSHFDSQYLGGEPGELMTPALGPGEIRRTLDGPVLGVLAQQGWGIVPPAITPTISATAAPGAVTVTWDPNLDQVGTPPLDYRVRLRQGQELVAEVTAAGGADDITVNQLTNGATYEVEVTPFDAKGAGSPAVTSVTVPAFPNRPRFVRSDGVGLVRTVSWQLPVSSGGGPEVYTVDYRPVGGNWTTIGTTSTSSLTTPTLSEQPYQFRVRATNDEGSGEYSFSTIIGASDTVVRPFPLDGQVARLYSAYFLREPDQDGFEYWLAQRGSGVGLSTISAAFASSPEFIDRYGSLSDSQFVDQVYLNVTGRNPDAGGRDFWIAFLAAGNSRGEMMIGFSESAEYQANTGTTAPTTSAEGTVYRLYLAFFLREPDAGGLSFWTGRLNGGQSIESIANGFAESAEFQAQYSSLSDDRFVELVYENVLIRTPDAGGFSYWTGRLGSGAETRGEMMSEFADSLEFIIRTGSLP